MSKHPLSSCTSKTDNIRAIALSAFSIGALTISLSGCEWMGMYEKEKWIAATSRPGWDTFTFKGKLPAEFGIDAIAFYSPNQPDKASCQTAAFYEPGTTVSRRHVEQYTAEFNGQAQEFSFKIPLSYYKGLCGMSLGRVKLEINARYGSQDWQQAYGRGNLNFQQSPNAITNQSDHEIGLEIVATCSWLFQQSKARSILGEIEKRLICTGAGAELTANDIAGKIVKLHIEVNYEQKPSHDDTWIKFPNGWKPCAAKDGWRWCREPIEFQTFKMNGQTCTVYPGCTE